MLKALRLGLAAALAVMAFDGGAAPVTLREAVRRAVDKARAENTRTALAESQLRLLEAQAKWKFGLRPTLGLFSFSNPGLLAASIGSGLMLERFSAPSALTVQSARVDVVGAEVAAAHARVDAEVRAGQAYFELLERQQVAGMLSSNLGYRRAERASMAGLVKTGRATALDVVAVEMQMLEIEQQQTDAEMARQQAALTLANLMGMPELAGTVTVTEETERVRFDGGVPAVEALLEQTLAGRSELKTLRERLRELEGRLRRSSPVKIESATTGYAYLTQATGLLGNGLKGALLGGNTGRGEANFVIPLRKTGEKEAAEAVLAARIQLVRDELRLVEAELRQDLALARNRAVAATARQDIARRKLELLKRQAQMVAARADGGLAERREVSRYEQESLRAEAELSQADNLERASHYALRVVSGGGLSQAGGPLAVAAHPGSDD